MTLQPDKYGEWRPIPSLPNWWASSKGFIKRVRSPSVRRANLMVPETRPTRGYPRATGFVINIAKPEGGAHTHQVSRLVCEAFHGLAPSEHHWARHIDGNPFENSAANLCWKHRTERGHRRVPFRKSKVFRVPTDNRL